MDSEESIPPAYLAWQVGTTNMVVLPGHHAGNLFLGSLKALYMHQREPNGSTLVDICRHRHTAAFLNLWQII